METKKQEAIRLAYGEYWEKCKNYIDENGWCNVRRKVNFQEITDKLEWETKIGNQYVWRPKSLSGIEDNNGWISLEKELPPIGIEVLFFNEKWIDEDFNPKGIRIGFKTDEDVFSAYWWDYQDTYMSISHHECDDNESFSDEIKESIEPTHWKLIEDKKPIF